MCHGVRNDLRLKSKILTAPPNTEGLPYNQDLHLWSVFRKAVHMLKKQASDEQKTLLMISTI